jgi:hypothetical protein
LLAVNWSFLTEPGGNRMVFLPLLTSLLAVTSAADPEVEIREEPNLPASVSAPVELEVEAAVLLTVGANDAVFLAASWKAFEISFLPEPSPNKRVFALPTSLLAANSAAAPGVEIEDEPNLPEFAVCILVGAKVGVRADAVPSAFALVELVVEAAEALAVAAGVGAKVTITGASGGPSFETFFIKPLNCPVNNLLATSLAPNPACAEHNTGELDIPIRTRIENGGTRIVDLYFLWCFGMRLLCDRFC